MPDCFASSKNIKKIYLSNKKIYLSNKQLDKKKSFFLSNSFLMIFQVNISILSLYSANVLFFYIKFFQIKCQIVTVFTKPYVSSQRRKAEKKTKQKMKENDDLQKIEKEYYK